MEAILNEDKCKQQCLWGKISLYGGYFWNICLGSCASSGCYETSLSKTSYCATINSKFVLGKMIGNLSKDFTWQTINIYSKFSTRYHYTVDKFLAVAVLSINIHVIIYMLLWYV